MPGLNTPSQCRYDDLMNRILLTKDELKSPLSIKDPRGWHILNILKASPGDLLDGGIINGPYGTLEILEIMTDTIHFDFQKEGISSPLLPLTLLIGCPRPPTASRLLKDMTTIGLERIWFCGTDLGEKSYLTSKLWRTGKYREQMILGAQQAESTLLPDVRTFTDVRRALQALSELYKESTPDNFERTSTSRFILDHENDPLPLRSLIQKEAERVLLAVGPERGFTDRERHLFQEAGFHSALLGTRILRTETACSMGAALLLSGMEWI